MSKPKYAIGIDFGTESGRAALVDVADGWVLARIDLVPMRILPPIVEPRLGASARSS